ncbi:MAG: hypothetical protein KGP12_03775 [Actinomycetales bacterium]|nr:hypothetical protein [Actinomycetales bacterium]
MQSRTARVRSTGIAIGGTLALASTLLLAGCGGGTSTESTAADNAQAASAEAVSSEPPRPSGLTDEDWATLVESLGNADAMIAEAQAKTPEEVATDCQKPAKTDEELQAFAEDLATQNPESTVEEWIALLDWGRDQAAIARNTVCADIPAEDAG